MRSIGCDAVLAYREECTIYEDVCILQSYGTAVQINPKWINDLSYKITTTNSLGHISVTLAKASEKICESMSCNFVKCLIFVCLFVCFLIIFNTLELQFMNKPLRFKLRSLRFWHEIHLSI